MSDGEHHQHVVQWKAMYTFAAHVACTDPGDGLSRQDRLQTRAGVCPGGSHVSICPLRLSQAIHILNHHLSRQVVLGSSQKEHGDSRNWGHAG